MSKRERSGVYEFRIADCERTEKKVRTDVLAQVWIEINYNFS